jgi:hypothetical protein
MYAGPMTENLSDYLRTLYTNEPKPNSFSHINGAPSTEDWQSGFYTGWDAAIKHVLKVLESDPK